MKRYEIREEESGKLIEVLFNKQLAYKAIHRWNRKAKKCDNGICSYFICEKEHDDRLLYDQLTMDYINNFG